MKEQLTSPRSGATKTIETSIDLSVLGFGIALAFEIARYMGHAIPEGLETKAALFIMALGGTVARWIRHWLTYARVNAS